MEPVELAFQEWSLAASAPEPGWIVIDRFLRRAIWENQILSIMVFDSVPGGANYLLTTRLAENELRSSGLECVRGALRRDAFVMLLLQEPLNMREVFGEYVLSAEGQLRPDAEEQLFGGRLEGFQAALDEGRRALVISHDGDPLFLIRQGLSPFYENVPVP